MAQAAPLDDQEPQSLNDPIGEIKSWQNRAVQRAVFALDQNADDAAKANRLADATGSDPGWVHATLDDFQNQHRAAMTSEFLRTNAHLQDYVNSHPLAATISNDDWANLDALTESLDKWRAHDPQIAFAKGFAQGFGGQPLGSWQLEHGPYTNALTYSLWELLGLPLELPQRGFSGIIEGFHQAAEQGARNLGADESHAAGIANEIAGMLEAELTGMSGRKGMTETPHDVAHAIVEGQLKDAVEGMRAAMPYIQAGEKPPVGLHPWIDKIYVESAKTADKNLAEVIKNATSSMTGERDPEMLAHFINLKNQDKIEISAEAVARLYGDKVPEATDNLLGWVDGIQDQLAHARAHGGDIVVPLGDFIAHVKENPELYKELREDIRSSPGGLTLAEAKELPEIRAKRETVTLYRGEFGGEPAKLSEWLQQAREEGGPGFEHAQAEGRWWTDDPEIAKWYQQEAGEKGRIVQQEVPKDVAEASRVSGLSDDIKKFSRDPEKEFFLPPEYKGKGKEKPQENALNIVRDASGINPMFDEFGRPKRPTDLGVKPSLIPETAKPGTVEVESLSNKGVPKLVTNVRDMIDMIDPSRLDPVQRKLHDFFAARLRTKVGDVPVYLMEREFMDRVAVEHGREPKPTHSVLPGFYYANKDAIYLDHDTVSGQSRSGYPFMSHLVIHEAVHALTHGGLSEFPELAKTVWSMASETQDWINKNAPKLAEHPDIQYAFLNADEFMSQALSEEPFRELLTQIPISDPLRKKLGLTAGERTIWDIFREIFRRLLESVMGKKLDDTMLDGVLQLERAFEKSRDTLRMEGKVRTGVTSPARGDFGIPGDRLVDWVDKMNREAEAQKEVISKEAERVARLQVTKEWKDSEKEVRRSMKDEVIHRPDVAADILLGSGTLFNRRVKPPKLRESDVPEQYRETLAEFIAEKGVHPDDIAGIVGFNGGGQQMLNALMDLKRQRDLEGLTPSAYVSKMVDAETERAMLALHGDFEKAVLEAAKDHAYSPPVLDRLSEEIHALGIKSGVEGEAFNGKEVQKQALADFEKQPVSAHNRESYMSAAAKAGLRVEAAMQAGKWTAAFKAKQEQYVALYKAKLAKQLTVLTDRFDKLVDKALPREPSGMMQQDAVWIHDFLQKLGYTPKRPIGDLERQKQLMGGPQSFGDWVMQSNSNRQVWNEDPNAMPINQQMVVSPAFFDPNYKGDPKAMRVEEFRDVYNALASMTKFAKDANSTFVKGERVALNEVVDGMVQRIEAAFNNKAVWAGVTQPATFGRWLGSTLLSPTTWFERLDLGNRLGPFSQLINKPIMEAQYDLKRLERQFKTMFDEIPAIKNPKEKIQNDLFKWKGEAIPMVRRDLHAILVNMGNALQREKLIRGWGIADKANLEQGIQKVWAFLARNGITEEDLARAQKIGDIFSKAFDESERAYTQLNGVAPARIPLGEQDTPWGKKDEWYYPLIPDPIRQSRVIKPEDMLDESGFYRPSPASGYTKQRTGAIYPIHLSFDSMPFKLKQVLNDAAMRPAISEVSKIIFHKDFQDAFKRYYGKEYADGLMSWMKDAAGNRQWSPASVAGLERGLNFLQQNVSNQLIGWNLGTVFKHAPTAAIMGATEVGTLNLAREVSKLIYQMPGSRESWRFAFEHSEEIQNRLRTMSETIANVDRDMFRKTDWSHLAFKFRDAMQYAGSLPVGVSDLIFSVATWNAEYIRRAEENPALEHGDLVNLANQAVVRTHGSTMVSNRPQILRMQGAAGAAMRFITPFYNFFNNALNRNYELAWRAKLMMTGRELPEMVGFGTEKFDRPQQLKRLAAGILVFGVIPSLIEEYVDPLPENVLEDHPALRYGYIMTRAYPSMLPVVRDLVNGLVNNRDVSAGVLETVFRNISRPVKSSEWVKDPPRILHNFWQAAGALGGVTYEAPLKQAEYINKVYNGEEKPGEMGGLWKGIHDIVLGLTHGTQEERKPGR